MSISKLPLCYCTNVHAGRSVGEVDAGLDRYTVPIARQFGAPLAAGLWLARPVVDELLSGGETLSRFADGLRRRGLTCHTLNAFPYGDFHADRVKENVYLPDWTRADRLEYTLGCAQVLATLLPEGAEGSISTLPLGFKGVERHADFLTTCMQRLTDCALRLERLHQETGKLIRLAIEPEPFCVLETTREVISFFQRLWQHAESAGLQQTIRNHIGLCFDICHQAVEFEQIPDCIRVLDREGIRLNKVHISCALQLDNPRDRDARAALRSYVEPRYLHQTIAQRPDGGYARAADLDEQLIDSPGDDFLSATAWRVHFHVPVDADSLGPLSTTRPALRETLGSIAELDYAPHLEVETYTWEVLPGQEQANLVDGLSRELLATQKLLCSGL